MISKVEKVYNINQNKSNHKNHYNRKESITGGFQELLNAEINKLRWYKMNIEIISEVKNRVNDLIVSYKIAEDKYADALAYSLMDMSNEELSFLEHKFQIEKSKEEFDIIKGRITELETITDIIRKHTIR